MNDLEKRAHRHSIVVIGAGIIGTATALRLQLDGHDVTLLDRSEPMLGCSAGNAGHLTESNIFPALSASLIKQLPGLLLKRDGPVVVRPSYALKMVAWSLHAFRLADATVRETVCATLAHMTLVAIQELQTLAASAGASNLLHRDGVIYAFKGETALQRAGLELPQWQERGVQVRQLAAGELNELEPGLISTLAGGLMFENAGRCSNPQELGLRMFNRVLAGGGQFLRADAQALRRGEDGIDVQTSVGLLHARRVVLCGGYDGGALLRALGVKVPLASERGYHLMLPKGNALLQRPIAFPEHYFIATPMDHGVRLAGTAEFCRSDAKPDYRRTAGFLPKARQYITTLDGDGATPWMGVRPSFPDGLPAIGELASIPGLLYAFGHGHSGLTLSGITASYISALIAKRQDVFDPYPLDIMRFA